MTPEDDEQNKLSSISLEDGVLRENQGELCLRRRIMDSFNLRAQFLMHSSALPWIFLAIMGLLNLVVPGVLIILAPSFIVVYIAFGTHLPINQVWRLKLDHIFLLCMSIEQADERLGDLDEKRERIIVRHGAGYARFWYWWTGLWIVVFALLSKLPGKHLFDAVISRIAKP